MKHDEHCLRGASMATCPACHADEISAAVDMLARLAKVPAERRMDTLALAIKVVIESGNRFSNLAPVWEHIQRKVNG